MRGRSDTGVRTALPELLGAVDLGPLGQVSFAVADFDGWLRFHANVFGPFQVRRYVLDPTWVTCRGEPCSATIQVALGRLGDVEIEVIAVEQGDYPTAEYVRQHGDGVHHLGFYVTDLVSKQAALQSLGFEVIVEGGAPRGSRFCYLEGPKPLGHCVIELFQRAPTR